MHKKINVDYFKNKLDKLPPVQLPRIKSRKIFSTKSSPSDIDVPPPLPKVPPPTIVDRTPVTLSTISALVEGAPKYDYSFGGAEVSEEVIERHLKEDTKKQHTEGSGTKSTRGFSEKLTKHYKEFSEFKFKNILGRKTIVRTTEIQVDMYKQRYEEDLAERESSDKSDYDDFDVHSLPSGADRRASSDSSILPTRESVSNITVTENDENLQNIDDIEPIESTLYRIKKRSESMEINENTDKDSTNNSKTSHRQAFDNACDKAKKAVNLKFQKLLQLRSKSSQDSVPTAPERKPTTYRKPPVKQESVESGRESLNSSMEASVDYNRPKHDWTSKRILSSDSIETPRCLKTRYYGNDDNDYDDEDDDDNNDNDYNNIETTAVIIAHRPAPPIPKISKTPRNEWVANNEIITAFHMVTPPSSIQKRNLFADLMKAGHSRKPSMDSVDSDSWIPDTYRNNRSPIALNKIDENIEPWSKKKSTTTIDGLKKLRKIQSIDIFTGDECEHVFEDFDDALRNVPVIPIVNQTTSSDLSAVKRERPSRPLIQQASLARRFSDDIEAENLNIDVNKLISQFEPNIVYNNKTEKIKVTAVVETTTTTTKIDHSPSRSSVKDIAKNSAGIYEEHLSNSNSPCTETFRSNTIKRKPISAKEWALRAKAARSLEPGVQGSDDIFYSFDSGNYAYKPPSPRKKVIRRKVYRIDL